MLFVLYFVLCKIHVNDCVYKMFVLFYVVNFEKQKEHPPLTRKIESRIGV